MSRGPGTVMRAALHLLETSGEASPDFIVQTAYDLDFCDPPLLFPERVHRSKFVAARRAMHQLAERGVCELERYADPSQGAGVFLIIYPKGRRPLWMPESKSMMVERLRRFGEAMSNASSSERRRLLQEAADPNG